MKNLYLKLEINDGTTVVCKDAEEALDWIVTELHDLTESESKDVEYTITPLWLSEEEFALLPEFEA